MARRQVYYGWVVVGLLFVTASLRTGFTGFLYGIMLKPMSQEFGWSRGMTTGAVTLGTYTGALLGYGTGRTLDRYGPRVLMPVAMLIMGACYLGMASARGLVVFYLAYAGGRALAMSAASEGMVATVVSKWFVRRRGRAIGIAAVGGPLAGATFVLVFQAMINAYGWRSVWLAMALMAWTVAVVPGLLFLRRTPEDLGLQPDGDPPPTAVATQSPGAYRGTVFAQEQQWTFHDAVRTRSFWLLSFAMLLGALASTAVGFHLVPYLTDVGVSPTAAAGAMATQTIAQMVGIVASGYMLERMNVRRGLIFFIGGMVLGTAMVLLLTGNVFMAFVAMAVYGLASGGYFTQAQTIWAIYFGRRHLGAIRGLVLVFQLAGNGVGPQFSAMVYDATGSYTAAFLTSMVLLGVMIVALAASSRPVPRTQAAS